MQNVCLDWFWERILAHTQKEDPPIDIDSMKNNETCGCHDGLPVSESHLLTPNHKSLSILPLCEDVKVGAVQILKFG